VGEKTFGPSGGGIKIWYSPPRVLVRTSVPLPSFNRTFDSSLNSIFAFPEATALKVIEETKPAEVTIPPGTPPLKLMIPLSFE